MGFSANLASLFVNIVVNSSRAVTNLNQIRQGLNRTTVQARQMQLTFAKIRTVAAGLYILRSVFFTIENVLRQVVQTTAELERNFTRIKNAANLDTPGLTNFKKDIIDLSDRLRAIPVQSLQSIGLAAAQAGIKDPQDILKFSEAVGKAAAVAEEISAGDLAKFLLLLRSQFKGSIDDVDNYANALHVLAQEFRTNEAEIVKVAEKIVGFAKNFGLTADQTLALAAALREVGVTAERSSSFVARIFRELQTNAPLFESILGLSPGLEGRINAEPLKALVEVLEAISKAGTNTSKVLIALNLDDVRVLQTVQSLTNDLDKFKSALDKSANAITNTSKVVQDFKEIQNDLQGALDNLSGAWTRLIHAIGDNQGLKDTVNLLADAVDLVRENPWLLLAQSPQGIGAVGKVLSKWSYDTMLERIMGREGARGITFGTIQGIPRPERQISPGISNFGDLDKLEKMFLGLEKAARASTGTFGDILGNINTDFNDKIKEIIGLDLNEADRARALSRLEELRNVTLALANAEQNLLEVRNAEERALHAQDILQKQFEERREAMGGVADFLATGKQGQILSLQEKFLEIFNALKARDPNLAQTLLPQLQTALTNQLVGIGGKQAEFTGLTEAWKKAQLDIFEDEKEVPILTLKELQKMKELEEKNLPALPKILEKIGPARAG